MFGASSENATLPDETPTGGDIQRPAPRRFGARSGLFAVPEDREVLRTPQENDNTVFVFGKGTSSSTETDREATRDGDNINVDGSLSAPPNVETATDREEEVQTEAEDMRTVTEAEDMRTVTEAEVEEQGTEEAPSLAPISTAMTMTTTTHDSGADSPPARPNDLMRILQTRSSSSRAATDEDDGTGMDTNASHTMDRLDTYGGYPTGVPTMNGYGCMANPQGFQSSVNMNIYANMNITHYYPVPNMEEFLELDREAERLKQLREMIAARPLPIRSNYVSFAKRIEAVKRQMSYTETTYDNSLKSWVEQVEEADEAEEQKRKGWQMAIKRARERTAEEEALVSEAESARRKASLQNTLRMLKDAEEKYGKVEGLTMLSIDEMEQLMPVPFDDNSYYIEPTRTEMYDIITTCGVDALKAISNVKIGRDGFGEILFEGPMNLEGLDFEKEIEIKRGHLLIKEVDKLAGCPATVTLLHVYKHLYTDVQRQTEKELKEICDQPGHQFISYELASGKWIFKVDDFKQED